MRDLRKRLLATTIVGAMVATPVGLKIDYESQLTLAFDVAKADFVPPPPKVAGKPASGATSRGGGGSEGPLVVACVASSAGHTIGGAKRQGRDRRDPRAMTAREAAVNMIQGCPATVLFAGAWLPYRDTAGVLQSARIETVWRASPQGVSFSQTCMRGAMDGCATNGLQEIWVGQWNAYHYGHVPKNFAKTLQKQGIQVTAAMVEQAKRPLVGKNAIKFNGRHG